MHCKIIDRHFNVFFVEMQLKKENFKCFLCVRVYRYNGLPNGLLTYSKSIMETPEQCDQGNRSYVFIVNFENNSLTVLFPLLTSIK